MIPLGQTTHVDRYVDAERRLPGIDTVVGHSMGGSVALELAKHFSVVTRTYGAPVLSLTPSSDRFRDTFDPFSMFDLGAVDVLSLIHI